MINIRFAKEDELEQVNVIRKQVHKLHVDGRVDCFKPDGWDAIKDVVKDRFVSDDSNVVVACNDSEIVGFAIIQYIRQPETPFRPKHEFVHIEEFCVDSKCRRQGIASLIIDFIKDDALKRGISKLELNMWEFNESALKFYESVGFKTYRRDLEIFLTEDK